MHWIGVKEKKWWLRAEVIGFKALSGTHSGENLGRYAVGTWDCSTMWVSWVGITQRYAI